MFTKIRHRWNSLSQQVHDLVKHKTSVHSIAMSFAIGTCIAILPLFGMSVLFGLIIVLVFEKLSKISLFGAIAFWNPFALIPVYWLSYKIGDIIFTEAPVIEFRVLILNRIYLLTRRFLVGNIIVALALSLASYCLVFLVIKFYRKHRLS